MANVIIFGLITSTGLNMVVVPAAYYALHVKGAVRDLTALSVQHG